MLTKNDKAELRSRLLAEQTSDPNLRLDHERRLLAMFETRLTAGKKLWFVALTVFCLGAGASAVTLAVTEKLPPLARTALIAGAIFSLAWVAFLVNLLRRGSVLRRVDPPRAAGMAFLFSVAVCILMAVGKAPTEQTILMAVLLLIPAGLIVLRTAVEQSEMRTQERLVELQYRVAQLAERLDDGGAGSGVLR